MSSEPRFIAIEDLEQAIIRTVKESRSNDPVENPEAAACGIEYAKPLLRSKTIGSTCTSWTISLRLNQSEPMLGDPDPFLDPSFGTDCVIENTLRLLV